MDTVVCFFRFCPFLSDRYDRQAIPLFLLTLLVAWVLGYFTITSGSASIGFGVYKANLLAPIISNGWSYLIKIKSFHYGEHSEGFNYLGLGILLLILLNGTFIIKWLIKKQNYTPYLTAIIVTLLLMIFFSLSNNVGIAGYNFTYPLSKIFVQAAGMFRSSGRFLWIITYFITVSLLLLTIQQHKPAIALLIVMGVSVVQVADTYAGWGTVKKRFTIQPSPGLADPFWSKAVALYDKIRLVPFKNVSRNWIKLASLAQIHGKGTDVVYLTRVDRKKDLELTENGLMALMSGNYEQNTLYVTEHNLRPLIRLKPGDSYIALEGFYVLVPKIDSWYTHCEACIEVPESELNRIDFVKGDTAAVGGYLLKKGWSDRESWGV